MNLNELYTRARTDQTCEKKLFECLSDSFSLFVRQRVRNRQDSEEIVQEALTAIARHFKTTSIETSFAAWAYRILENKLRDYYRMKQRHLAKEVVLEEVNGESGSWVPNAHLMHNLRRCLEKLSRANQRYARILSLHLEGQSIEEICEVLKMSKNAIYLTLSRARKALRDCLDQTETD